MTELEVLFNFVWLDFRVLFVLSSSFFFVVLLGDQEHCCSSNCKPENNSVLPCSIFVFLASLKQNPDASLDWQVWQVFVFDQSTTTSRQAHETWPHWRAHSLLVSCILTRPTGSPKYGATRKNIPRYYTLKPSNKIYVLHCKIQVSQVFWPKDWKNQILKWFFSSGIINLLFKGLTDNTRGHFAQCS